MSDILEISHPLRTKGKIFIVFLHEMSLRVGVWREGTNDFFALLPCYFGVCEECAPENDQHSVHTIPFDPSRGIFPPNVRPRLARPSPVL